MVFNFRPILKKYMKYSYPIRSVYVKNKVASETIFKSCT